MRGGTGGGRGKQLEKLYRKPRRKLEHRIGTNYLCPIRPSIVLTLHAEARRAGLLPQAMLLALHTYSPASWGHAPGSTSSPATPKEACEPLGHLGAI